MGHVWKRWGTMKDAAKDKLSEHMTGHLCHRKHVDDDKSFDPFTQAGNLVRNLVNASK